MKFGTKDDGTWLLALKDLTPKALEEGIMRLMFSKVDKFQDFPPNCMQFRTLCLEAVSAQNLPSLAQAFTEARNWYFYNISQWSHPAVRFTAAKLAKKFWETEDLHEAFQKFAGIYSDVCFLIRQGHEVPYAELKKNQISKNPDYAKQQLQQIKKKLGFKVAP